MKPLVHPPSFLISYQQWWLKVWPLSVVDVEFAVLILRICSYAAQFLPSVLFTADRIYDMSIADIRKTCTELGDSLAKSCLALDWTGSLTRVQHILYAALTSSCEGKANHYWEGIASASQAAQKAGLHKLPCGFGDSDSEMDKEMRRRVFCSLYILDRYLTLECMSWKGH